MTYGNSRPTPIQSWRPRARRGLSVALADDFADGVGDEEGLRFVNPMRGPEDRHGPRAPTLAPPLTYGGAVHDQRYIVSVPQGLGERQGWYTVLRST